MAMRQNSPRYLPRIDRTGRLGVLGNREHLAERAAILQHWVSRQLELSCLLMRRLAIKIFGSGMRSQKYWKGSSRKNQAMGQNFSRRVLQTDLSA